MKVLIGSKALSEAVDNFYRPVNDIDYFSEQEIAGAETFYHPALEDWAWGHVATLDELYTIKISHSFWKLRNNSWGKHMSDISWLQNKTEAKLIPELYSLLYGVWSETYGVKKANLEQEPDEFFNPSVQRTYEHDSIHASVAYYSEPLFNEILRDDHAVAVSKFKFDNLTQEKKFQLVREEIYATALERHLIPSNYEKSTGWAYNTALMQTITSFSKGWFPLFIVENYSKLKKPDIDYLQKHMDNKAMLKVV